MKEEKPKNSQNPQMDRSKMKAVYTIIDNDRLDKPLFRRIGIGFVNRDDSINVYLDALPIDGKLHLREPFDKREDESRPE